MGMARREKSSSAQNSVSVCPFSGATLEPELSSVFSKETEVSCVQIFRIAFHWVVARGNFSEAIRRTLSALGRRSFSVKFGKYRALFTTEQNRIQQVLVREPAQYPKTQWEQRVLKPVMDGGLIILEDDHWQHDRRVLAGCFGKEFLAKLPNSVHEACHSRIANWRRGIIDVSHEMRCIVNDVIRRYFLGEALSDTDEFARLYERAEGELEARVFDPFRIRERYLAWKDPNWKLNAVVERISHAIAQSVHHEQSIQSLHAKPLQHLLGKLEHPQRVVEEVRTLAAASLTTGHLLSWLSYLLALNPDSQSRLRDEIACGPENPTLAQFEEMKYLGAVIHEGLRLYPPAPFLLRTARGSNETDLVFIPIWAMHRDPEFWFEPTRFVPERWFDQKNIDHEMFIPFGLGARVCIGKRFAMIEARIVLYNIVRNFWLEPLLGYQASPKMDILTRPRKNMKVLTIPAKCA